MFAPSAHTGAMFALAGSLAAVLSGCAASAAVRLQQPVFEGLQRDMELASRWAVFEDRPPYSRYQFSFPLPGAVGGDKHYHLFLLTAEGPGDFSAGTANPEQRRFRGFFIQVQGPGAGLTEITGGTLTVRGGKTSRTLELAATFDDGTKLAGRLRPKRNRYEMDKFEKAYGGDIRALLEATAASPEPKDKKNVASAPK